MASLCSIGWLFLRWCPKLSLDLHTTAHPFCVHLQMILEGTPGWQFRSHVQSFFPMQRQWKFGSYSFVFCSTTVLALFRNPIRPHTDPLTGAATKRRAGLAISPVPVRFAPQTICSHDSVGPRVDTCVHPSSLASPIAGTPSNNPLQLARVFPAPAPGAVMVILNCFTVLGGLSNNHNHH